MNAMLLSGLELMMVGMGIVFAFLILLVWTIKLMSALIQRYGGADAVATPGNPPGTADQGIPDAHLAAVISAAIHCYRTQR